MSMSSFEWKCSPLLMIAVLGWPLDSFSQGLNIEGDAVYQLFDNGQLTGLRSKFSISIHDEKWIISTLYGSSNRLTCAYDGQVLRTLNSQLKQGTNSLESWSHAGFVESRKAPSLLGNPFLHSLWLAFCSADYLRSCTNGRIEPFWPLDDPALRDNGFSLPATWTLSSRAPFLPHEIVCRNEGVWHGFDASKQQSVERRFEPPYDKGYICARYVANSFTNVNDFEIPLEFILETYQTPLGKDRSPDLPRDTMVGRVRTVSIATSHSENVFRPAFTGRATIYDYALGQQVPSNAAPQGFVNYKGTNGHWPQGEELRALSSVYSQRLESWRKLERGIRQ